MLKNPHIDTEKIRGKEAPEKVRIAATYVGLLLLASLMIFVMYLDIKRFGQSILDFLFGSG